EHQAVSFLGGAGDQMLAVLDQAAELRLVRYADGIAGRVEGPAVETAGEAAGFAALIPDDPCAAVRADVEEGADLSVLAAHDDHRNADVLKNLVAARFGNIGG